MHMTRMRGASQVEYLVLCGAIALGTVAAAYHFRDDVRKAILQEGDVVQRPGGGGNGGR